ncbi:hypothetical protein LBW60_22975 [Ralstonia solanacearum]|uniref:hypothetical protein n=1 Tax=Ralstonia solanacearum TaxID=305 RepID=UPI001FF9A5F7|nr:hypothetical protein [Ralstonia solanacearum]MDB0511554.1 hypothetical protein [Ralstonia solanacearum]MDB0516184.1 hypothetical protein [Ralstonia solanacearum]
MQSHELIVGINAWVIQDGNYGDFSLDEQHKFAIEFYGPELTASAERTKHCRHVGEAGYVVTGEVIFATPTTWVLDFGIKVFCESRPPPFAKVGQWAQGNLWLGVDPFFYKEYLHKEPGMPGLSYEWTVTRIRTCKGPWIEKVQDGQTVLTRDPSRQTWADILATDAWRDDDGRADYMLTLERDSN